MKHDESFDVGVIGGGAIGLACAWRLAQAGARVAIFEREQVGREASWAAAGMLAAQCEDAHFPSEPHANGNREAMLELCLQSRALYPVFLEELCSYSGLPVEASLKALTRKGLDRDDPRTPGIFFVGAGPAEQEAFARQQLRGLSVEDAKYRGAPGVWLSDEGQVKNRDLVNSLKAAAVRAGVCLREHEPVRALLGSRSRVRGFTTSLREVQCGCVLLSAGAWSSPFLSCVTGPGPVGPVKGEMLVLRPKVAPDRILYSPGVYLVPRRDGRVLVGATVEQAGFDTSTAAGTADSLRAAATRLWPDMREAPIEAHWAGLRPGTCDGLPILGRAAADNLYVATGHFRNGILLTPLTADLLTACILDGNPIDNRFGLERFEAVAAERQEPALCSSH